MSRITTVIRELRRRKVFRAAVVYVFVAWVLIQIADATFENLPVPEGSGTLVIVLAALGFPLVLVLAWAYDLTPDGFQRDAGPDEVNASEDALDDVPEASVAVLPFADMSPDRDQEFFCDGVAEEILNTLTQIEDLHVASRTSSFRFKGLSVDIGEIARELRVATVLEGSVRKADNQLRVTAQLIDARNGYHLWSERYDRTTKDIFMIQDQIARHIAEILEVKLTKPCCKAAYTEDVEAYEYYLQGWNYFHKVGPKNMAFARQMFCKALEIDPTFAKAWAGLADAYGYDFMYYNATEENRDEARKAAAKALELAPTLAEAHASRGFAHTICDEFDKAAMEFEEAIRINPNLFEPYYLYARNCFHEGNLDKAAELFQKASDVRPLDYQSLVLLSRVYAGQGKTEESLAASRKAVDVAEKVLEHKPDEVRALYLGTEPLHQLGETEKALKWAERALFIDPDDPSVLYNVACFYALAGEIDRALDCLERANLTGMANRSWITHDADLDPLRDHPRFKAIVEKLKC